MLHKSMIWKIAEKMIHIRKQMHEDLQKVKQPLQQQQQQNKKNPDQ